MNSLVLSKRTREWKEGAYATVFFLPDGQAVKLFKRRSGSADGHVRSVFESEVKAYEIASAVPSLKKITPTYFGRVEVHDVLDESGVSIGDRFHLDYAYQLERIPGDFIKIGKLHSELRQDLIRQFLNHGIRHVLDASVVFDTIGKVTCVIDFAIEEHEEFHPTI